MFRHLLAATCAVLIAFAAGSASAQTISQPVGIGFIAGAGSGQSFTATLTGTVTQIQVRPRTSGVRTLYFFNGAGSGTLDSNASAVYSQSVTLVDQGSYSAGLQTIVLTTPLPVTAGNVYTFAFDGATSLAAMTPEPYAGGVAIQKYNIQEPSIDIAFTITEAAPASVPTMTEWAIILFGLILAGGAALAIQRQRVAV
jgi:hypothetical protein